MPTLGCVALIVVIITIATIMITKYEDEGSPGTHRGFHRLPDPPSAFLVSALSCSNPSCCHSCQVFKLCILLEATLPLATPLAGFSKLGLVKLVQLQLSSFLSNPASNQPSCQVLSFRCKPQGHPIPWVSETLVFQTIHGELQQWGWCLLLKEFCFQRLAVLLPDSPGGKSHCCNCSLTASSQLRSHLRCFCRRLIHH